MIQTPFAEETQECVRLEGVVKGAVVMTTALHNIVTTGNPCSAVYKRYN